MKQCDPAFQATLQEAADWLMKEFISWNVVQGELEAKGYESNHYSDKEIAHKRYAFQAIAERFVLEDLDFKKWQWFETPWAGTDGNTGMEAYIVDFATVDAQKKGWGILAFYVTRNPFFWFALPLAELPSEEGLSTYETNSIQTVLNYPEVSIV